LADRLQILAVEAGQQCYGDQARRLRGKTGWVVCTSIYDEPPHSFVRAFADNFAYFGMRFGGLAHVNCESGYDTAAGETEARRFAGLLAAPSGGAPG